MGHQPKVSRETWIKGAIAVGEIFARFVLFFLESHR